MLGQQLLYGGAPRGQWGPGTMMSSQLAPSLGHQAGYHAQGQAAMANRQGYSQNSHTPAAPGSVLTAHLRSLLEAYQHRPPAALHAPPSLQGHGQYLGQAPRR